MLRFVETLDENTQHLKHDPCFILAYGIFYMPDADYNIVWI